MSLIINTNVASLNAQRNLGVNHDALSESLGRLSSGLRINSSADDPAGLAIATKFGAQVNGLNQAVRNSNNATALLQTAAGGISTLTNMLQTLRTLAVQSSSSDNTSSDRANLAQEAQNLQTEITRIATTTQYNTQNLLDGTFSGRAFQIGANYGQTVSLTIGNAQASALGGRSQFNAEGASGLTNATNNNFGSSAVKINGYGVAATSSANDQYSVLEVASSSIQNFVMMSTGESMQFNMVINSVLVNIQFNSTAALGSITAASIVDVTVSAINAAKITGVSAYAIGSTWAIRATGGTDLQLAVSAVATVGASWVNSTFSDALNVFGIGSAAGMSTMFGSVANSGIAMVNNYNGQSSAMAKTVAINAVTSSTGVTATTTTNSVTATAAIAAGTINSGDLYINGVNIGAVTVAASDGTGTLVSAINNQTNTTGVAATTDGSGKLVLTASDDRNITITSNMNNSFQGISKIDAAYFTNAAACIRGTVQLTSQSAISVTGSLQYLFDNNTANGTSTGTSANVETGLTSKSLSVDVVSYNVGKVDISTQNNAQAAILTVDAALNQLQSINATIGALQNRLGFTVANLQTGSQNMAAAQSTIMDADFAAETATFQRNQILVQAGTAMVAQANTAPQIALQLLK